MDGVLTKYSVFAAFTLQAVNAERCLDDHGQLVADAKLRHHLHVHIPVQPAGRNVRMQLSRSQGTWHVSILMRGL